MANDGKPLGFINAEELTAFRTALASSLLMTRRFKVKTVTVFGAGKQAYLCPIYVSHEQPLTALDTGMSGLLYFFMGRRFGMCI
jgi:ornithine cyclodeaminase/alanine dehydrogenase-like protein (mu-crystallin family)